MSEQLTTEKTNNYKCTIYLKAGMTITIETTDPDSVRQNLTEAINKFYRRGLFRNTSSVVRLHGTPETFILVENINFFTIQQAER
jgi:hypothetical protein